MGRPTDYTPERAAQVCERLSAGDSLRTICAADDMPSESSVYRWLAAHEEFRKQYACARERQAEYWAEEILEIADDGTNDWMERQNKDGTTTEVVNTEVLNRSRLRVDTRKWLMSKLAPKKYGDKVETTVQGPDGGPVKFEKIERTIVHPQNPNSGGV